MLAMLILAKKSGSWQIQNIINNPQYHQLKDLLMAPEIGDLDSDNTAFQFGKLRITTLTIPEGTPSCIPWGPL